MQVRSVTTRLLVGAFILLSRPLLARAGNDDAILIGGQASLTAGAITATVSDGSAAWYNPAGIAKATRNTVDINASAYGISRIVVDDLFTLPDGTSGEASVIDWQLVPSALSYVRELGRVTAGFGIFIPTTTDADLRSHLVASNGSQWTLAIDELTNEYDYIVTVGARVTDTFRLGVSVHGIYTSSEEMVQVGLGSPGEPGNLFMAYSQHRVLGDYGARLGIGAQWTATPRLDLGAVLVTPTLTGFRRTRLTELNGVFSGTAEEAEFLSDEQDGTSAVWELSRPLLLRLGVAYRMGRAQLLFDGSLTSPLESREDELDRKLSANARVAMLVQHSDALTYGLGAFTDFNGARQLGPDFVGVAGGLSLSSHYHLAETGEPLTFITTLGGRYAYGWGYTEGVSFAGAAEGFEYVRARMRVHELAFNLGGCVTF